MVNFSLPVRGGVCDSGSSDSFSVKGSGTNAIEDATGVGDATGLDAKDITALHVEGTGDSSRTIGLSIGLIELSVGECVTVSGSGFE